MTNREATIAARALITEQSEGSVNITLPRLHALIPTALYVFGEQCKKNSSDRSLLQKPISITFASGVKDISAYVNGTSNSIDLKDISNSTLYDSDGVALTWVAQRAQLNNLRQLDADSVAIFLDGYTIRTKNTDGSTTSYAGTVIFQGIDQPSTVAEIPDQLTEKFVIILADLGRGGN
jgi:hypothetical protein